MINNRVAVIAALASLVSCAATPGDGKAKPAESFTQSNTTAVSWYPGYRMSQLLAKPIQPASTSDLAEINRRNWYSEAEVIFDEINPKEKFTLSSCNDYLARSARSHLRLRTVKPSDNGPFMVIALMCRATQLMQTAKKAERSFLEVIHFDENLPKLLPKAIAMVISGSERARIDADKSIKSWNDVNPIIKVEKLGPFQARYHDDSGGRQELALVAKGDFDGDGTEDMLITSRNNVEGGSYFAIRLFLLTLVSASSAITVLREYNQ